MHLMPLCASMHSHEPLALIDARLGRNPSGIGYYLLNLTEQLSHLAPGETRPICWPRQVRRLRRLGFAPVLRWRTIDPSGLPAAKVIHGPNFHAPEHPTAAQVATIHDLGFIHLPECHPPGMPERLDALIRESEPRTTLFICDSEWTRQDFMAHYGVSDDRCRTVHLGVSGRFGEGIDAAVIARGLMRLRLRQPYLLHVGAMVPRKDLTTLLATFRIVAAENPDMSLVLAGHKTLRWASDWERIQEFIRAYPELRSRIRVLNYVRDADLPILYSGAAVSVSTSLLEGFGLTVLEGLASGTPVVATRGSAVTEIAQESVHFGDARQPETYAQAIAEAIEQTSSQTEAGRRLAAKYSWQVTAKRTLQAYRDAAAA